MSKRGGSKYFLNINKRGDQIQFGGQTSSKKIRRPLSHWVGVCVWVCVVCVCVFVCVFMSMCLFRCLPLWLSVSVSMKKLLKFRKHSDYPGQTGKGGLKITILSGLPLWMPPNVTHLCRGCVGGVNEVPCAMHEKQEYIFHHYMLFAKENYIYKK